MPNIPQLKPSPIAQGAQYSTGPVSAAAEEIRRSTEAVARSLASIERNVSEGLEREQRAQDVLEATRLENTMNKRFGEVAESYQNRMDYENFDDDLESQVTSLKEEIRPPKMSRNLEIAFETSFGSQSERLSRVIRRKKLDTMSDIGKSELLTLRDTALEEYAKTSDEIERGAIEARFGANVNVLRQAYLIDPFWASELTRDFGQHGKKLAVDLADVEADRGIAADPASAVIKLQDHKFLPNLPPKVRQDKIEKANVAYKIQQNQVDKEKKEQEKEFHDTDDRNIANLFMAGNLKTAYSLAQSSKYLSGDEKRVWANAITQKSKKTDDDIDPVIDAINYSFVNELISNEADSTAIKRYIYSSEFKTATRQKLLDRLDSEKDKAVNAARSRAYDYMKSQIMPYRGMLAEVPPLQASQYTKAMNALDDWIKEQKQSGKPISSMDIRAKSEQLALDFQTTVSDRQKEQDKEMKGFLESLKKKKEGKVEPIKVEPPKPQEKYEVDKIYTDAQGRKAKYLGGGKWQLVK